VSYQSIRALGLGLLLSICALPLAGAPNSGKLSGVVVDAAGTPQLGATVFISSEDFFNASPLELLTNDRGRFAAGRFSSCDRTAYSNQRRPHHSVGNRDGFRLLLA
jgi:hypothetical protein